MHLGVVNTLLADGRADQGSLKLRASPSLDEALGLGLSPMSHHEHWERHSASASSAPLYHVACKSSTQSSAAPRNHAQNYEGEE